MFWMMTKAPRLNEKYWALAPHVLYNIYSTDFSLQQTITGLHSRRHTGEKTEDIVKKQTEASYLVGTTVLSWWYGNQSIKMTSQLHLLPRLTSGPTSLLLLHALISQRGVTLPFYVYEL
jgi:hypothetical protein